MVAWSAIILQAELAQRDQGGRDSRRVMGASKLAGIIALCRIRLT